MFFKGSLAKLWLTFPSSKGTQWAKTEHQCCGVGKVNFSRVVLWVALWVRIKGKEKENKKKKSSQRVAPLSLAKPRVSM